MKANFDFKTVYDVLTKSIKDIMGSQRNERINCRLDQSLLIVVLYA